MKSNFRIKYFRLIWTMIMLLFFMPAGYVIGGTISRGVSVLILGVFFLMLFLLIWCNQFGYFPKKTTIAILIMYLWCTIGSSLLNGLLGNRIDVSDAVMSFATATAFVLACDLGFHCDAKKTLECFLLVGITMCALNAITIFLFKNSGGMNPERINAFGRRLSRNYFLLAEDNASYFWSWPVLVVSWIYYYLYNQRPAMRAVCVIYTLLLISSYLYVWSVLAFISCISVPVVLMLLKRSLDRASRDQDYRERGHVPFTLMWISGLLFNYLLSIGLVISYFTPILQKVLRKDATLSSRTLIWERSFAAIKSSPIIGFGNEPIDVSYQKILLNHTHNLVIETLYRGGFLGLILFCVVFMTVTTESRSSRDHILNRFLKIMLFFFIIYSSIYFAFYRYHYLILFVLLSYLKNIFAEQSEAA